MGGGVETDIFKTHGDEGVAPSLSLSRKVLADIR